MSRRTRTTAVAALVLLGLAGPAAAGTAAPALAPAIAPATADRERVCVITGEDGEGGTEGICVWFPDLFPAR